MCQLKVKFNQLQQRIIFLMFLINLFIYFLGVF